MKFWFSLCEIPTNVQRTFVFWWLKKHQAVCSTDSLCNQSCCGALGRDRLALSLSGAGSVCHPWAGWRLASLSPQEKACAPLDREMAGKVSKDRKNTWKLQAHSLSVGRWEGSIPSPTSVVTLHKDNVTQMLRINNSGENKRHKTRALWTAARVSAEVAPVSPCCDKVCIWTLNPDVNP